MDKVVIRIVGGGFVIVLLWIVFGSNNRGNKDTGDHRSETSYSDSSLPDVEAASAEQTAIIQRVLGGEYPIRETAAVKSQSHRLAWYVGASFGVSGHRDQVGIWIIDGEKDKPNTIYAVDGFAHEFSGMRLASETKVGASVTDTEARALKKALNK